MKNGSQTDQSQQPASSVVSSQLSVAKTTDRGPRTTDKARYIMIGGFLGAGKTTAVAQLARHLTGRGIRVGLITNDQGNHLVDTAMLSSRGFPTEEIAGGCFCCRFNSLMEAAQRLTAATKPDVFIAEPVGSCTDLVATVTYPLRRIYGNDFSIAPLSVVVDPIRALRVFGMETGGKFSDKVLYIYRKQLEEADIILLNKCDLLDSERREKLRQTLAQSFPRTTLLQISARKGTGLDLWFERLATEEQKDREAMEVDYDIYAEGEALLGWLNATVRIVSQRSIDGNALVRDLAAAVQQKLLREAAEIAHLKMTLEPDEDLGDLAVINLVRNDYIPELSQVLSGPIESGVLTINLRAETAPEFLRDAINEAVKTSADNQAGLTLKIEHLEFFRPGKPVPTHRFAGSGET